MFNDISDRCLTYLRYIEEALSELKAAPSVLTALIVQVPSSVGASCLLLTSLSGTHERLHQITVMTGFAKNYLVTGTVTEPVAWALEDAWRGVEDLRAQIANLPVRGLRGAPEASNKVPGTPLEAATGAWAASKEMEDNLEGCRRHVHGYHSREAFESFQQDILGQLAALGV